MARKATINSLHTRRLAAIDVFSKAANDLLAVGADYRALADQAYAQADTANLLGSEATANATIAEDQAAKIRAVLG